MSTHIVFFGNAQGFISYFFDNNGNQVNFNSIIKDFDLLESRLFSVDKIDNKEILSRYNFTVNQDRKFCLIKLYSFAQAYNISRIEGCIYGVGLISDSIIDLSKNNLDLLNVAKKEFAKLSLDGLKFNKSDFQNDVTRICKAIVNSKVGNLLDNVAMSPMNLNNSEGAIAYKVDKLFESAIELNSKTNQQDKVYFSEDFEHLKRTQIKWGKNIFPIYLKDNNQYIEYKEKVPEIITVEKKSINLNKETVITPPLESELKTKLTNLKNENEQLKLEYQTDIRKLKKTINTLSFFAYSLLLSVIIIILIWIFIIKKKLPKSELPIVSQTDTIYVNKNSIPFNNRNLDNFIEFAKVIKQIYAFDPSTSNKSDNSLFEINYTKAKNLASVLNISVDSIKIEYTKKKDLLLSRNHSFEKKDTTKQAQRPN